MCAYLCRVAGADEICDRAYVLRPVFAEGLQESRVLIGRPVARLGLGRVCLCALLFDVGEFRAEGVDFAVGGEELRLQGGYAVWVGRRVVGRVGRGLLGEVVWEGDGGVGVVGVGVGVGEGRDGEPGGVWVGKGWREGGAGG